MLIKGHSAACEVLLTSGWNGGFAGGGPPNVSAKGGAPPHHELLRAPIPAPLPTSTHVIPGQSTAAAPPQAVQQGLALLEAPRLQGHS